MASNSQDDSRGFGSMDDKEQRRESSKGGRASRGEEKGRGGEGRSDEDKGGE